MNTPTDVRALDATYRSPPSFREWSQAQVDSGRLARYLDELTTLGATSESHLKEALRIVSRAAAVDTGALERLYEVDRGFTMTVALEAAAWEGAVEAKGSEVGKLIRSQLEAYDFVLDFATGKQPLVEAWIRQLHAVITAGQDTYQVSTPQGVQNHPLPKGQYKTRPNHVIDRHGKAHAYAPVDLAGAEVNRLAREMETAEFLSADPVLQASYAHYAFVAIHPFADGNGRVARALASVFTYRAYSVPVLILAESRNDYLTNLEAADRSNHQEFVDFMLERVLDALRLAYESLRAAGRPSTESSLSAIKRLFVTKGGLTHSEVDQAALRLAKAFEEELRKQVSPLSEKGKIDLQVRQKRRSYEVADGLYRLTAGPFVPGVQIAISTNQPADATVNVEFQAEVPKDPASEDDLLLRQWKGEGDAFAARLSEVWPNPTIALRMRLAVFVEGVLREALERLRGSAAESFRKRGYDVRG